MTSCTYRIISVTNPLSDEPPAPRPPKEGRSMQEMFDFLNAVTSYGIQTQALEASFRKRGNQIRKCHGCDKVQLDDYETLNRWGGTDMCGEWVNRPGRGICPYRHHRESDAEYYTRTGKEDIRRVGDYMAYIRYERVLTPVELRTCPYSIQTVGHWHAPKLGRTLRGTQVSLLKASPYMLKHELIQEFNRFHRLGPYVHLSHPCYLYWDFKAGTCQRYLDPMASDKSGNSRDASEPVRPSTVEPPVRSSTVEPPVLPAARIRGEEIEDAYPALGATGRSPSKDEPPAPLSTPVLSWAQRAGAETKPVRRTDL